MYYLVEREREGEKDERGGKGGRKRRRKEGKASQPTYSL